MESERSALRALMAELGRANRAIQRGALDEARQSIEAALAIDPQNARALQLREQLDRSRASGTAHAPAPQALPRSDPRRHAGWSAFELRVRERRAARCVESARDALALGNVAAAREAVDELTSLVPLHPALGELRQQVERTEPVSIHPEPFTASPQAPPPAPPETASAPAIAETRKTAVPLPRVDPSGPSEHAPALEPAMLAEIRPAPAAWPPSTARRDTPRTRSTATSQRSLAVMMAAAAVLVIGVLLPIERTRPADPAGGVQRQDAPEATLASVPQEASVPDRAADADALTSPDVDAPLAFDDAGAYAQTDHTIAATEVASSPASAGRSDERAVMTSGAAARVEDETPRPARRPAEAVEARTVPSETRSSSSLRDALAAREIRRAAAAQQALRSPATPAPAAEQASDPPAEPVARPEPSAPESSVALARLDSAASMPVSPPPAVSPSVAPAASVAPSQPLGEAGGSTPEPPGREAAVRDVLQRYVSAYNRLDAVAAQAVWPAVNQGALERAFAQLDSQMLRFDRCDIDVDEEAGTATCAGQARWVPRVGARDPKREQRTWQFELTRNGDDWIITRAEARR